MYELYLSSDILSASVELARVRKVYRAIGLKNSCRGIAGGIRNSG